MANTRKTIEYKPLKHIIQQRGLRLDDRVFVHHDSFKTNPPYNMDNRGRLLPAAPCFRTGARCDSFLAKVIEPCPDAPLGNTTSLYYRAVINH
jgi:hypothetical protein